MRYARLFGKTIREVPHGVRSRSQALLVQGGYIRSLGQGLFYELPLALRVLDRLQALIREEMSGVGGQEVRAPLVNPWDIWLEGGRSGYVRRGMIRFTDRDGHDLVLSPSHEEAMVQLVKDSLQSYRDLPVFLYQFQTKYRDEERTRSGLIRAKEFMMKDGYSFHRSSVELNNFFPRVFAAYERILKRCGIPFITAESGVGFMGGEKAYEFLMPSLTGDDIVIMCENCGYRANREIAKGIKEIVDEPLRDIERIHTPDCTTMGRLARTLDLPRNRLAKAMVYRVESGFVMAVVRGDFEISEEKLAGVIEAPVIGLASANDLESLELIPGYLSPIGRNDLRIVVDDSVSRSHNLVFGANTAEYHVLNGNFGRDFITDTIADIAQVNHSDRCLQCHHTLEAQRAVEVGNIFKLGDFYTRRMALQVQDDRGVRLYPHMGSYGIGLGRLMSCVVEANCDDRGICWPEHLAPYRVFLMGIGQSPSIKKFVYQLHDDFEDEILLDDRMESPGVKFKDADLLGIPLRVVVSPQLFEKQKVELQERAGGRRWQVPTDRLRSVIEERLESGGADRVG